MICDRSLMPQTVSGTDPRCCLGAPGHAAADCRADFSQCPRSPMTVSSPRLSGGLSRFSCRTEILCSLAEQISGSDPRVRCRCGLTPGRQGSHRGQSSTTFSGVQLVAQLRGLRPGQSLQRSLRLVLSMKFIGFRLRTEFNGRSMELNTRFTRFTPRTEFNDVFGSSTRGSVSRFSPRTEFNSASWTDSVGHRPPLPPERVAESLARIDALLAQVSLEEEEVMEDMDLDAQPSRFQGSFRPHTLLPAFLRGAMLDGLVVHVRPPLMMAISWVRVHLLVNAEDGWYATGYNVRSCSSSC